jgi:hypothetical protein
MKRLIFLLFCYSANAITEEIIEPQIKFSEYPHGVPKSLYQYKLAKLNGNTISWYPNGQVEFVVMYTNGQQNGIARSWYNNGNRQSVKIYKNGLIEQKWKWSVDDYYIEKSLEGGVLESFNITKDKNGNLSRFRQKQFGSDSLFSILIDIDTKGEFYRGDFERYYTYSKNIFF